MLRSLMHPARLLACGAALLAGCTVPAPVTSQGQPYEIVALGASNTEGRGRGRTADGVPPDQAYPAQLERLLQAHGCPVHVLNAGRAGDTTDDMLARLPSVLGPGTKVVILQPGQNDDRRGTAGNAYGNVAAIRRAVRERGAEVVMLDELGSIAGPNRLPDGQHFSAEGHARFAAYLAPRVRSAGACPS